MAEVKEVIISGEELARRIRVVLEYSIQESEALLNKELVARIAGGISKEWFKDNRKKIMTQLKPDEIAKEVMRAIVAKAVFHLAVEQAHD